MANQQVKINLLFDANTSAAQSNIQQLATLLQTISTKTIVGVDSGSLQQAVGAAQQLQVALQNAVNVDTGKIDLMKLQADLKQSGTSLQTLTSQLRAVGPTGEQAFLKVANAVAQAEVPMIKANGLVKNFMTTLANTAKWQIASSAIHAIIGAFQSATAHAKNLNKALTDIQIVTHASTAEMAAFAEKATQAASALNTTSTEYAKAALIFYQQGLSGDAVTERADTVIKLAQVTGQSAQIVSDQMTSIWNNFDDGSKSLEYYADVLTKLGATTAASTDEIAQGLQKFSAIAGTVGMEYETAAAAIATVVAETRQSADVVGTAFKTIFARIQGLSLGETLEDGVDLNKYSKALSAVGVEVLTADGELRKMDDILADLGEKWQGLGEETQVALAQVTGGTRQYSQMIALMDNWDKVTDNIDDAKDATGELAAQQEIWTHSYEASMTRMTQAKNELYESFINDDFLIGWNDAITVLTKSFTSFIDRIGGLGPFLFSLVGIFSKTLFPLITTGLTKISNMLAIHTGKAAQQVASMQSQMSNSIGAMLDNPQFTEGMKKQLTLTQQLLGEKQKLMLASKTMTEAQKLEAQSRLQVAEAIMNETMQILQQQDALEKQARAAKDSLTSGKQKWDVATTSAENSFRAKSDANAAPNETEEQAAARHAADDEIINTAKTTGVGTLETQIANARKYQANQQQLDAWAPTVQKTDEQAANGEAWSREDQSIRDQAANKSAEQEELLATLPEDALSDLDAYIEKLTKAREIQKDIYNIVNDSEGKGVAGASVGSAEVQHDASFGEGEEVGKVEANQLQNIADSSEGAISFDQETGALGMEASLANYEKLYQVLGEHKVLQSELAAATQEVGAAQEAAKGKTAEYEAATEELANAEKELAALEKKMSKSGKTLTDARKAELKQISKGSKEYKKLSKEEKDYVKIQEKVKKATENQTKAQKKAVTQFTAQKKSYEDLATKAGATGDQMKKLTGAFDALESGSGDVDDQFKIISSVFKELGISSDGVSGDIVELGNKMQTMLSTAGYSDDQIDILTQAFQELANTAPQAANGIKGTEGALGGLNSKAPTLASSFGSMAQNAMTLAGNMMSLKSGIEGITTAFTEGGSAADIMQGVLTGIMGIMPTVIAITNAAKAAQDRRNKSTLEGVGADVAKTASEGVKTGVTWANTIANIANLLSNPWTMALAAVAIVAIGVVCASMESKTEATEANTQANLENAESTNELSSAWADATTAMDTAIAKFNELTAAGKDTKQSIQDIIDAIPDLVQSYRDAAASMAGLTDEERTQISETADYIEQQKELLKVAKDPETQQQIINNINEAQAKNDNVISENAAEEAQKGATAAMSQTAQAIVDVGDAKWEDGKVKRHVGGAGTQKRKDYGVKDANGKTVKLNEEEASVDILMQAFGQGRNVDRKNGFDVSLSTGSSEDFLADYEKLMEAATQMENQLGDQLDNSDTYREVKDMLNGSKEQYEKLKEMQAEADKYGVFDAKSNLEAKTFEGSGEKMAVENISSMEEYKKYKEALLSDENVQDPAAQEIAKQWLESNAALEKYVAAEKRIEGIRDNAGDAVAEDLYAMVDKLDDEQTALFLEVDVNKYQTEAAIMSEIERLQGMADQEEIQLKIEAINNAQSALKESGMTQEDWTTIKDSGIDWGNEEAGIMEFTDFLKMSYSDQQAYLQQMENDQNAALIESAEATKAALEENLKNLDENSATYEQDKALIEEQIQAEKDRLAIIEKTAQADTWEGMDLNAGEVEDYAKALQDMATSSDEIHDSLATDEKAAKEAAKEMARYNKAVDALTDGYDDWSAALKSGNISEQVKAAKELDAVYADMLDLDLGQLSDKFLQSAENLELAEKAAQGNKEAYNELQSLAAQDIYAEKIGQLSEETLAAIERVANTEEVDVGEKITVGESTVADDLWTIYNDAYMAAIEGGKSVAEAKAIANSIMQAEGFDVGEMEMEEKQVTVTGQLPTGYKPEKGVKYTDSNGVVHEGTDWEPVPGETYTYTTTMLVPKSGGKSSFTKSAEQVGGKKKKSDGGGGGEKKKADEAKKSDTVERYKEITDQLDDNTDAMDKASRAADRLYGKDRLAKMKEVNKLLQKEIDLTKKKREEALKYLKEDRDELDEKAKEAGVSFTYDDKGNITNYEEEMTKLFNELDSEINKANADGNADEDEQKKIDAIQEKIDKVKDAMSTYEDTRELIEDLDTELEEKLHEWQDANFEILNTELELKIEINDMDLQRLEYYLGKMEDDFYQMAEAAALMVMNAEGNGFGGQLTSYMDQLQHQEDYLEKLHKQYAAGEISQANYIEGLKNASSAIYEQLGSLQELDSTMMEYYSETLAAAGEEIAKYTDLMESASGVLEHYTSLAELMGKSTDYKYMGNILSSQAKVASDAYKVSKANYDMLKDQEADREKAYKDAYDALKASGATDEELANNAQLELLEKQWWDAQTATAEAQDQMLSDAEAWAEALGAILDNALSKAAQNLENILADGFGSFDAMNSAFERKNALQEEYLTTTNKIYETNKMMRTAQQEIDKTTNEAAKRKLKQFINETDALQDQTELSQYELEIQQMKYDLLLAEIALEEAQNAKSTVRLQRDNEGNMSYVYTADANKVADAQQKFEDAQNALYNKGLEGANDYVQKYQETMQEMYDTLTEIDQNYRDGAYESELEYQNAIEEAKEYYYKKLTQYSNLYQVALTTDTRVAADAWTTEFASMTERTGDWMTAVDGYIAEVADAFGKWKSGMDLIHTDTLANIDQDLQNIESDSGELATTVTDKLIPALEAEMDAVADVTEKYATFREELEKITAEYEEMAKAAEDAVKVANGLEDGTDSGNPGDGNTNEQNDQTSNSDNNTDNDNNITNSSTTTYTVKAGDTLSSIGAAHGVGWKTIYEKNKSVIGDNPNLIIPGQVLQFASGGYTGDWSGSYGKLAFLHKKELILKQGDTENFLASMEILERILQMIDLQATSAQLGGILATPKFSHYNNGVLEQNVHIEASFPGVTDHNEVELAMTNLINTASQYANRK